MAMWDFTLDSEIQTELSQHLKDKAAAFDNQVKNMYGKVNELSQYWVGEDYEAFKNGTENYSGALQELSDGIRMYAKHFDKIAEGTENLATELISNIENMTKGSNVSYEQLFTGSGGGFRPISSAESSEETRNHHSKSIKKNVGDYTPQEIS